MSPLNVQPLGQKNPLEEARGPHAYVKDGPGQNQGHYEPREQSTQEFPKVLYRAGKSGERRVVTFTVKDEDEERQLLTVGKRKGHVWVELPSELEEIRDDVLEGAKLEDLMHETVPFEDEVKVIGQERAQRRKVITTKNELGDDLIQRSPVKA